MFNILLFDSNKYINFLYHGIDRFSKFNSKDLIYVFRNKYKRLHSMGYTNSDFIDNPYTYAIKFINILKNEYGLLYKMINIDKLSKIENLILDRIDDKLFFNNIFSITFIELNEYDYDAEDVNKKVHHFFEAYPSYCKFIHNDSKKGYIMFSFDIPVTGLNIDSEYADVRDFNPYIITAYYELNNHENYHIDSSITKAFTSELIYSSTHDFNAIIHDGLFFTLFYNFLKCDYWVYSLNELEYNYYELMRNINETNILHVLKFHHYIVKRFIDSLKQNSDELPYEFITKFNQLLSIDIKIINILINITDSDILKNALSQYNQEIICLNDNYIGKSIGNKLSAIYRYKNQILRSRDKLKERVKLDE